jgi:glucosylceramidase
MYRILISLMIAGLLVACAGQQQAEEEMRAAIIRTSRAGDRLKSLEPLSFSKSGPDHGAGLELDPAVTYQEIVGFGGSFTESSAYVLSRLSAEKRQSVIDAYFSSSGSAYSLTRTHINSCDFSLDHYAYVEPDDMELETFTVEHDMKLLIPLIRDALAAEGAGFRIISSPWTAPDWMKDNGSWYGGSLKPGLEPVWARYFSMYLRAYREQGVEIWGITPENEPLGNDGNWDSMHFTPESMRDFIRDHLGPRLRRDGWDTRILIFDQNRDHVEEWADVILGDPEAAKYVWGTAVHWYSSTVDWYPDALNRVHERFPDKHIMHTEGCIDTQVPVWQDDDWYWRREAKDWGFTWAPEEKKADHPIYVPVYRYARDIIGGLNSWMTGWIDWNIVLDRQGGPNLAQNWCIAPVIADPETDEVYFTPLYYTLAHFSRYIRPGARRIEVESRVPELMATACVNPDGQIVAVLLNQQGKALEFPLRLGEEETVISIPGESIQTILIDRAD